MNKEQLNLLLQGRVGNTQKREAIELVGKLNPAQAHEDGNQVECEAFSGVSAF